MATKVKVTPKKRKPKPRTVQVVKPNPEAWSLALDMAGGDARRLRAEPDGSVLIANAVR